MIEAGQIHASIDDSAGMVTFLEDPEQYHSAEVVDQLSKQITLSNDLSTRVQAANCQVSLLTFGLNLVCNIRVALLKNTFSGLR